MVTQAMIRKIQGDSPHWIRTKYSLETKDK